jgi:hypothetical protein
MVSTCQQLTSELDAAYREFRQAVEGMSEEEFQRKFTADGKWGTKEIVAHLTGWHGQLASGFERMARGERPVPEGEDWNNPDPFNEVFAEHATGKTKDQVLHELDAAVNHFKEAAAKLPDDRFGEGKTANKLFDGAGISHFREHLEDVRQAAAASAR